MSPRLQPLKAAPDTYKAVLALEQHLKGVVEPRLYHLLKLRASQINGCAYCIDLHAGDARKAGESERRLAALSVWHETPFFTDRERAAR